MMGQIKVGVLMKSVFFLIDFKFDFIGVQSLKCHLNVTLNIKTNLFSILDTKCDYYLITLII